eukprot:Lithocolla_globosa_v1_NODE_3354_length_1692_cov_4.690898.p1 type:complete len:479 gc:universal NODE_3354_length_1692_cov_4.690898:188-1624(+)
MGTESCVCCHKNTKRNAVIYKNRKKLQTETSVLQSCLKRIHGVEAVAGDILCGTCVTRLGRLKKMEDELEVVSSPELPSSEKEHVSSGNDSDTEDEPDDDLRQQTSTFPMKESSCCSSSCSSCCSSPSTPPSKHVILNFTAAANSHGSCVICGKKDSLRVVPPHARVEMLVNHHIYSGPGNRICKEHLEGDRLNTEKVTKIHQKKQTELTNEENNVFLELILSVLRSSFKMKMLDVNKMSNSLCKTWTGWNKKQLEKMLPHLSALKMHNSCNRSRFEALVMFWVKLKTNLPFQNIASMFGIADHENAGRLAVSRCFKLVADLLNKNFVPEFLGVGNMTSQKAKQHNTPFTKTFWGDRVIVILDGTYFYKNKSGHYAFMRRIYSGQKKRALTKFMSIVFPDGWCLDTIGPFKANGKNNDAHITEYIFENCEELFNWLAEHNAMFVLDRGFRDAAEILTAGDFDFDMPAFLKKGLLFIFY